MFNEIKRKLFHLSGLIYVVGLALLPRPTFVVVMIVAVVVIGIFDLVRINVPALNQFVITLFGDSLRDQEKKRLSGVFWMALGVLTVSLIAKDMRLAITAVVYLLLGDGVASLVGMRLQGPVWPGSQKRLSGSLACFVMCLLSGYFILTPSYGWHCIFMGAFAATALEAFSFRINDNFLIPAASALVLVLGCSQTPPIHEDQVRVIYYFVDAEKMDVDCSAVKPVERFTRAESADVDSIVRSLLKGVNENERKNGATDAFYQQHQKSLGEYFEKVEINKTTAILYFQRGSLAYLNAPACLQQAVKGPIIKTLTAIPGIESVEFAIDGEIYTDWDA